MTDVIRFVLAKRWRLKGFGIGEGERLQAFSPSYRTNDWMEAKVPGVVHLDLLEHEMIPNPFFRLNEKRVAWIEDREWWYRKDFEASSELTSKAKVELLFHGLDTFATVWLNGEQAGQADNMFVDWRFDVKSLIRQGSNVLTVKLDSPTRVLDGIEADKGKLGATEYTGRVYGRKCQCSFGWDWGPRLPTSGIWKDVEVVAYDTARIQHMSARVASLSARTAELRLEAEIRAASDLDAEVTFKVSTEGRKTVQTIPEKLVEGVNLVGADMKITEPKLWWPSGHGDQTLYDLEVSIRSGGGELDHKSKRFGLRSVELVQRDDEEGKAFIFEINGVPIFCKGANWIPADSFLPRLRREDYEDLLDMAVGANMNMLRIWGGGIYESDIFYELCDEKGIMIWQDFMFACAEYPEEEWFWEKVEKEAEEVVKRLRNHPCIVLWCGNNENQWGHFGGWWGKKAKFYGETIYDKILPRVCKRLDPSRPYWPGSPYGGADPNSEAEGDRHNWIVWSWWQDYSMYRRDKGRFISEFGFQAPPALETIESFTHEDDRWPQSEVMEHHNKMSEGTERLYRFLAGHFKVPEDLERYVFLTQINQGEALRTGIEHWRRRKFMTSGALFWQLNDCWPVTSWSVIDYYHRPKPSYYYVKRCFSPLLVSLVRKDRSVDVWVTNDTLKDFRGKAILELQTLKGEVLSATEKEITVPSNSSRVVLTEELELADKDLADRFVAASLYDGEKIISQNTLFFKRFKQIELPEPTFKVKTEATETDKRTFRITVSSPVFARAVNLKLPSDLSRCSYSDNYFDLLPNAEKTVLLKTEEKVSPEELERMLQVSSL